MERDQAIRFVHDLLKLLLTKKGSDLFLTSDFPPAFKLDGRVLPVSNQPLTGNHTAELVRAIMNDRQAAEFEATKECNFAINPTGIGRFRVSSFVQQGKVGIVFRVIADRIPTTEELNLPTVFNELSMAKRGIVMVVGATGSGKSTSLAAMVGYRNENSQGHIITIEDPIEYVHEHSKSHHHAARSRHRCRQLVLRAEEHAAAGARCHPDRRNPRPRHDGIRHRVRRDRPPM
jgi:twitching motility protein PilU